MHRIIEIFSFASHQPQQRATLLRDCKMRNPTEAAIAKVEYISEICLFRSMLREMLHKASSGILHRERERENFYSSSPSSFAEFFALALPFGAGLRR